MRKKKQKAETIKVTEEKKASLCRDIRELYGRAMIAAEEARWKDYKFTKNPKGRTVVIEKIK